MKKHCILISSLILIIFYIQCNIAVAENSKDYVQNGLNAWVSFECATLASIVVKSKTVENRLLQYGYEQGKIFIAAHQENKIIKSDLKKIPPRIILVFEGPSSDFILGRIFEAAMYSISDRIFQEKTLDSLIIADKLFKQYNCEFLGEPDGNIPVIENNNSEVIETQGISDNKVEFILQPKVRVKGEVYGIDVYTINKEGNVGTYFYSHKSMYQLNKQEIIEDVEIYRLTGYLSTNSVEVEELIYTQRWKLDAEEESYFYRQANLLKEKKLGIVQKIKLFKKSRYTLFKEKMGKEERRTERKLTWLLGDEAVNDVEFRLEKSPNYGNTFKANFIVD